MLKKKLVTKEEQKKIKGGTPGGFDYLTAGPNAAKGILNAIKNYFK